MRRLSTDGEVRPKSNEKALFPAKIMLPWRQGEESASKKEIFGDFHQVVGSENHLGPGRPRLLYNLGSEDEYMPKIYRRIVFPMILGGVAFLFGRSMDFYLDYLDYLVLFIISVYFVFLVGGMIFFYNKSRDPLLGIVAKSISLAISIVLAFFVSLILIVGIYLNIDLFKSPTVTIEEKDALIAAENWLAMVDKVDKGEYAEIWEEMVMAEHIEHVGKYSSRGSWEEQDWAKKRMELGKLISRKVKSSNYAPPRTDVPAHYLNSRGRVSISFKTSFEHQERFYNLKDGSIEDIGLVGGKDGKWRVSFYGIKSVHPIRGLW